MEKLIYLNTAAAGLLSPESIAAANKFNEALIDNASTRSEMWRNDEQDRIRGTIAKFIGAPTKNIALLPNFSWGINGIVQSLKGDEKVLLYTHDYPSFTEPFKINKFDITWVNAEDGFNMDMDVIIDAIIGNKVKIVALSHVQWQSGYKIDLKQIGDLCKQHGVIFMVDATQSMGACHIDLSELNIDVFAGSNYKWMNGGFGTGFMYVADSFMEKYPPVVGGNNSYKMIDGRLQYVTSVQSYEPGHPNIFGWMLLEAAINEKLQAGLKNIETHNQKLTQLLLDNLDGLPLQWLGDDTMNNRAPIVFFKDENGLGDWLKQHNIVVTHRNSYLRTSMHFYNTEEDVMALVNCLKAMFA